MRSTVLASVAACVLSAVGIAQPAGATSTPVSLVLPQSAAFAILGHSCGGIAEKQYATGFDGSTGYPAADVFMSTTCSTGGRGSPPHTYTAWASATWDFTATFVSDAVLSGAPTVDPTLVAYDSNGNEVYNSANHAYLVLAPGWRYAAPRRVLGRLQDLMRRCRR